MGPGRFAGLNAPLSEFRAAPVLGAAVLLAYANSLGGDFQFDDYNVIVENPVVHSWLAWWADVGTGIRPLLKFSYTLNWTAGAGAWGFHFFNVAVHLVNAFLVFLLCGGLARRWVPTENQAHAGALAAALLFALHPVQTEAVTYISGRSVSLMALFYLGSLLSYARSVETRDHRLRGVSLLLFVAALTVKEIAVTLPLALLLWERSSPDPERLTVIFRRQLPYWLVVALAAAAAIPYSHYTDFFSASLRTRSIHDNVLSEVDGLFYLFGQLLCLRNPNIDPDLPVISEAGPWLAVEVLGLFALLGAAVWSWRANRRWVSFGILWFFLHLLPTNSVMPRLDVANDRQLYLPSIGAFLIVGIASARSLASGAQRGLAARTLALCALLALGALTLSRNRDYRDEISLWSQTVRQSPMKARAYNNLGYAYFLAGCRAPALSSYQHALRLKPDYPIAQKNLESLNDPAPGDGGARSECHA